MSLFINGNFDASGSIMNYNPFDYVSVTVGRFKKIRSFKGAIAELFVFFHPLSDSEIEEHYQDGQNELQNGDGNFLQKVLDKDQEEFNRQTFASEKKIPDEVLKEVNTSAGFFATVKEEPQNEDLNDRAEGEGEPEEEQEPDDTEAVENLMMMYGKLI
jgi:hypothetical protein